MGADPRRVAWAIEQVRRSLRADAAMPSLGVYVNVCVHEDIGRAADLVRGGVGTFAVRAVARPTEVAVGETVALISGIISTLKLNESY